MAVLLLQSSPSVAWAAYTWHVTQRVCVVHRLASRMTKHPLYLDRCVTKAVESPYAKCQDDLKIDIYPAAAKGFWSPLNKYWRRHETINTVYPYYSQT